MALITATSLPAETITAVEAKLAEIRGLMPFMIGLSAGDRMKLNPIGRKSSQFVQRVVEAIRQNPAVAPQFVDAATLEDGYKLHNQLTALLVPVEQLKRMVEDTMLVSGSDVQRSSLDFYNSAKRAAKSGVPGAQAIVDSLKPMFRKTRRAEAGSSEAAAAVPSGG
ncbi:MAG TPA: hypothetical protein PLP88_10090 [Bacteroidales bacterium]|nr:hypothetical protein [Bacteroidales bacterium]